VSDTPNATDLYGKTKRLGEISYGQSLTIRSSIVGSQITGTEGLFQWAISQRRQTIPGYTHAMYSGITTMTMAKIVLMIIDNFPELRGIQQIASQPIDKYELLVKLNSQLGLNLSIEPDEHVVIDRTLDGTSFSQLTGIHIPSWDDMLDEYAADQNFYNFN
jgi:dTDP-4-dehydrorhamnose reductase